MRILIISKNEICYNPRLLKAADYFSEKGCEVEIYNPIVGIATKAIYDESIQGKNWKLIENDISKRSNLSKAKWLFVSLLHSYRSKVYIKSNGKKTFNAFLNKGLLFNNIDRNRRYDWILINLVDNLPFAAELKKTTGAKLIYDSQEYFVGQYQKYAKSELDWVIAAEKKYIHDVNIVISTTNVMGERLKSDYDLKAPVVRVRNVPSLNMLKHEMPDNDINKQQLNLIWHGMGIYLNNTRGVHILVQAMAKVKSNVKLTLQGTLNPSQQSILNDYINKHNLQDKITVRPPADPYKIVQSLQGFDIGMIGELPEEDNQRLTSSNKLFDYINAGLAVVASDLPGLRETVAEYNVGKLYTPGNLEDLAEAIDLMAEDRQLLGRYQANSKSVSAKELYWEHDFVNVWNIINA